MIKLFEDVARQYPEYICQMEKDKSGKIISYSYEEVKKRAHALALSLRSLGLKRGDAVGIISDNRAYWLIADLAIMALGAADVPRGRDATLEEVRFILSEVESKICFCENEAQLLKVLSSGVGLETAVVMDGEIENREQLEKEYSVSIAYEKDLIEENYGKDDGFVAEEIEMGDLDDVATIIFTSGTTGTPKGVTISHRNLACQVEAIDSCGFPLDKGQRWLSVLPIWHSFERIVQYVILNYVSTIAYSKPIGKIMLSDLQRVNPHFMCSVPRIWETVKNGVYAQMKARSLFVRAMFNFFVGVGKKRNKFYNMFSGHMRTDKRRSRVLDVIVSALPLFFLNIMWKLGDVLVYRQVKSKLGKNFIAAISGGGGIPKAVEDFFYAIGIRIIEGYGMTETSPVIGLKVWDRIVPGAMQPFGADVEILIKDETGKVCHSGEKGVLYVKGSQVMKGYWKRPDLTEAIMDDEGYLNTGDLAIWNYGMKEYSIVGRAKDTIVLSGGENVEPVPIETKLQESPFIKTAVVVGQDRKYLSALLVIDEGEVERYIKENHIYYVDRKSLYSMPEVLSLIAKDVVEKVSSKTGFKSFEQIVRFSLLPVDFQVGKELSAKQELKRFKIAEMYSKQIDAMYC